MGSDNQLVWPREFAAAAVMLLRAVELADSVQRSPWDFAVEIDELRRLGLSRADLRWLVCQGFVDHAAELSAAHSHDRTFRTTGKLTFHQRSCFILTAAGRQAAVQLLSTTVLQPSTSVPPAPGSGGSPSLPSVIAPGDNPGSSPADANGNRGTNFGEAPLNLAQPATSRSPQSDSSSPNHVPQPLPLPLNADQLAQLKPLWDPDLSRLTFANVIVKEYRTPAPNQQLILSVFQEEGWPPRIDDPLPPHPDLEPKRRLHETIISLNRNQRNRILRFCGDGHGQGVRWQATNGANGN